MADPVNHDFASGTVTTGWETAKGVVKGALFLPVIGAVIAGAAVATVAALFSAPVVAVVGLGVVGAIAGGIGTGIVTAPAAGFMATAGGVLGLLKGRHRVNEESQAYGQAIENRALAGMSKLQYAQAIGQQQGAAMVADQLREMQYAQLAQKMGPCAGKHAAAIEAERKAAAAAPKQI